MIKKKVLFFGRFRDRKSFQLYIILKKNFENVRVCWSKFKKQKIPKHIFSYKNDFIISYRSYFILNKKILTNTKYAINFHPGPPSFRGIGCANFAIYQNIKKYGVTCHLINNKIDNGKIIKKKFFNIKKNINLEELLKRTHSEMFVLAKSMLKRAHNKKFLLDNIKKSKKFSWSRNYYNQSDLEKLYRISLDFSKDEVDKVLRATIYKKFFPYLLFDKHKISLNKNYEKL